MIIWFIQSMGKCRFGASFFFVCSAWAYSNGCKSLTSPNSGNRIANSKGVHREVESERSWRQTSDLTYRNFIQGIWPWMRLQDKSKSHSYSEYGWCKWSGYKMERISPYPRRSHGRMGEDESFDVPWRSKACREKSAEVIVPKTRVVYREGLNRAVQQ